MKRKIFEEFTKILASNLGLQKIPSIFRYPKFVAFFNSKSVRFQTMTPKDHMILIVSSTHRKKFGSVGGREVWFQFRTVTECPKFE